MNLVLPLSRKAREEIYRHVSFGFLFNFKQLLQRLLVELRADHAEAAGDGGIAAAHVVFAGDVVKVEPVAVA